MKTKMNKDVKKRWLAALRSGEYKQGKGALRNGDTFCCLGVLCDLHSKETSTPWDETELDRVSYDEALLFLPESVAVWAGLPFGNPNLGETSATEYNDGTTVTPRNSFTEIAARISKNL